LIPFLALLINGFLFLLVVIVLLCRAGMHRQKLRQTIIQRFRSRSEATERGAVTHASVSPHVCCPFWVPLDIEGSSSVDISNETNQRAANYSPSTLPPDLCSCLWNFCKTMCCESMSCWCQCCGMCAVAQEDREIQLMLNKEDLQIDYITFQPYSEYYGHILRLKENKVQSFRQHFSALSKLSHKIVRYSAVLLMLLPIIGAMSKGYGFGLSILFMTGATFSQAILVLYFVYWRWHRFDISLDAVVKYFAAGSFIGFITAVTYELMIEVICNLFLFLSILIILIVDPESVTIDPDFDGTAGSISKFLKQNETFTEIAIVINAFLSSFAVAAMIEELTKYFCFWIVEHPDFLNYFGVDSNPDEDDLELYEDDPKEEEGTKYSTTTTLDNNDEDNGINDNPTHSKDESGMDEENSLSSSPPLVTSSCYSAITIAMVSTAVGFAFVENLEYVMGDPSQSLSTELFVLGLRSLLPLHPILAAIQSIGVIRRDVEGDESFGLGKIILPAFLIHGTFDFILFVEDGWGNLNFLENIPDDDILAQQYEKEHETEEKSLKGIFLSLIVSFLIVISSILFFFYQRKVQRARLLTRDQTDNTALVELPSFA
jgi:hypothetical protein